MTARTPIVTRLFLLALLACLLWNGSAAAAEDSLVDAKRAYEAAAYEDALRLLEPLESPEARQYAALCLLALGRAEAATRAVEAMVTAAPLFRPSSGDVPPRFAALVTETRRKLLPVAARKAFADGRERYNAKQINEAMPHFELALELADDPLWRASSDAQDLRILADGFVQLAKATMPGAATASAPPAAAEAALPASPRPGIAVPSQPQVTPAIPIREVVPALQNLTRTTGPLATMKLVIDEKGAVRSAVVERAAHPLYVDILVRAAANWKYEPATLNGSPIESERTVTIRTP